ncbi:hypothetical protein PybrP1_004660, partial [[Pythium] brassicae (nom. inval.)]
MLSWELDDLEHPTAAIVRFESHEHAEHESLWRLFQSIGLGQEQFDISDFQVHFVVQFHLRELGWTLRSGLNYGGHYVLYRGAASAFHSEYIAYVKGADAPLSWGVLQALTRVAADVKKTVLVNNSKSLTEGEYEFFGRRFRFSAVAIRFWDVAGADAQPAPGGEQSWSFAFQPQPTLSKKLKKMPQLRAKRNLTSKI